MRWLVPALVACGTTVPTTPYLADRAYRRDKLEASLVNPDNGYSQVRLASYATPSGGWDAWPESNPSAATARPTGLDPGEALDLDIDPTDDDALIALGEAAFFAYPVQELPASALGSATSYGAWTDATRGLGGLVRYARADGTTGTAGSCATCHAAVRDGVLVPGLANGELDLGRLVVDAGAIPQADVGAHLAWGPGRLDVTTTAGVEPVRIPDLRAVRWLTHLQADATVRQLDRDALAIRIETLITTTRGEATRPPRIVALALATYLWSLADRLEAPSCSAPVRACASPPAPAVFVTTCAGCHAAPALTGAPVPLDVVGTDPVLGRSAMRGTGTYRVPSLHGVGQRALLLHDGSLGSLDAMFDPTRLDDDFTGGVRPGPVPGHVYGLDLSAAERAELLAYLEIL